MYNLLQLLKLYRRYLKPGFVLDELIFFVTYKCNFRCRTCFYADEMDNNLSGLNKELKIDEIKKISLSLGKFDKLLISGGEPFLREDLPEICEIFYSQNQISNIHLPSNGFFTEKILSHAYEILKKCPKVDFTLSLPLDGLEETHDKIKGIKGSFKRVIETANNLSNLKKEFHNLNIYIITVVNRTNINEIIELSEFVKNNLAVDGHGPSPVRGIPYDKNVSAPTYKEWDALSKRLLEYQIFWNKKKSRGRLAFFLSNNRVKYLYELYTHVLKGKKLPFTCQAGKIIGVLNPNGEIKLCELTETVGNARCVNYDFKKVWFSDKAKQIRKKIKCCACTHACFLTPSSKMDLLSLFRSAIFGK